MEDNEIPAYYSINFHKAREPNPMGEFTTAAVMSCALCRTMIDGMGGGGDFLCVPCGKDLSAGKFYYNRGEAAEAFSAKK